MGGVLAVAADDDEVGHRRGLLVPGHHGGVKSCSKVTFVLQIARALQLQLLVLVLILFHSDSFADRERPDYLLLLLRPGGRDGVQSLRSIKRNMEWHRLVDDGGG